MTNDKIRIAKPEIRNPKSETNPKAEIRTRRTYTSLAGASGFGLRILDFGFRIQPLCLALRLPFCPPRTSPLAHAHRHPIPLRALWPQGARRARRLGFQGALRNGGFSQRPA